MKKSDYLPMRAKHIDYSKLDPGIRADVRKLIEAGYTTTDSGDGVSKNFDEYPEALRFPHIAMESPSSNLAREAEQVFCLLGGEWVVEGSYSTRDKSFILFAAKER